MPMDGIQTSPKDQGSSRLVVLSIDCLKGSSRADEWTGDMLQTGDIVEQLKIGSSRSVNSPFKNGRTGIQKLLHSSYKDKQTSIVVRVRRGRSEYSELQACIVPNDTSRKKQYVLRSISDPNYIVGFVDRTESDCLNLQASRSTRMVKALANTKLQDGYVSYPWERRMQECLAVPCSSCFLSLLLLPKASDQASSRYNDMEDSLARANAWLNSSQISGVPIVFMNIQTESLLTKISGETVSSNLNVNTGSISDLCGLASASIYGFEDYHGVDIGVVRAVRLWYAPLGGELAYEIKLKEGDIKLGFTISRTEEGFIYISSVIDEDDNTPSSRAGLNDLYKEATKASRLLVISRISNQKVLPWLVSSTGAIKCFDTISLSQKLSLHRHAKVPISMHVFSWNRELASSSFGQIRGRSLVSSSSLPSLPLSPQVQLAQQPNDNQIQPLPPHTFTEDGSVSSDESSVRLERDTAGELSFRFHDFPLSSNIYLVELLCTIFSVLSPICSDLGIHGMAIFFKSNSCELQNSDSPRELNIPRHDSDSLGMYGAQVRILKNPFQIGLSGLLKSSDSAALESEIGLEVLSNFSYKPLERKLADEKLGALMILSDLPKSNSCRFESVRLLHSSGGRSRLPRSFCCQLLPRRLSTGGFVEINYLTVSGPSRSLTILMVTVSIGSKDLDLLFIDELQGSLLVHEQRMNQVIIRTNENITHNF